MATTVNIGTWPALLALIPNQSGKLTASAVHGGDINRAWHLSDNQRSYFVKSNSQECLAMFEAEQVGLQAIKNSQTIGAPEVIGCGIEANQAFIVMEYIDLSGYIDEVLFARQLAAMHQHRYSQFGFTVDNTIGSSAQSNRFSDGWVEFWREQRLGLQLKLAKNNRLDSKMIDAGERLNDRVAAFFTNYHPQASLLHGDLWSGNQGADKAGNPVIFDPACYYGDHQADLAMMELFGQPGQAFFSAYDEVFPIDTGYSVRRDLYNLYHVINHANLFGGGYTASARRLIDKLLAQT
jgi:protein-ribulosamine 3-kinase